MVRTIHTQRLKVLAHVEWQNISHPLSLDGIPLLQDVWLLVVLCATGNYMSGGTKCASTVLRRERNSDVVMSVSHHSDFSVAD